MTRVLMIIMLVAVLATTSQCSTSKTNNPRRIDQWQRTVQEKWQQ